MRFQSCISLYVQGMWKNTFLGICSWVAWTFSFAHCLKLGLKEKAVFLETLHQNQYLICIISTGYCYYYLIIKLIQLARWIKTTYNSTLLRVIVNIFITILSHMLINLINEIIVYVLLLFGLVGFSHLHSYLHLPVTIIFCYMLSM